MSVKQELTYFANEVINRSRSNLTQKKKNASKELYNSLDYELKVGKNSFSLSFVMEDYGKFIDKGVKGSESSAKAPTSPYQYKKGIQNKPSYKHFVQWVARKGLSGTRDKKGRFTNRIGIAQAISYGVWRDGIQTTNFFTKPFENAFKRLPEDLVNAYALEVENLLKFALK